MLDVFEDVYRHTLHGYPDADVAALTTEFGRLLGVARLRSRARDLRARRTEDRILGVLHRLRERPEHRWTVAEMARAAGLSTPHFAELFRLQTGSPPLTFLIRLRLQLACSILEREAVTIEQTAHRVGYEDAYYFSRLFRKHLGVAPSRFRDEVRGGDRKGRHRPGLFA
jgi:AraC-like DNA-binding protein